MDFVSRLVIRGLRFWKPGRQSVSPHLFSSPHDLDVNFFGLGRKQNGPCCFGGVEFFSTNRFLTVIHISSIHIWSACGLSRQCSIWLYNIAQVLSSLNRGFCWGREITKQGGVENFHLRSRSQELNFFIGTVADNFVSFIHFFFFIWGERKEAASTTNCLFVCAECSHTAMSDLDCLHPWIYLYLGVLLMDDP